jgi:hypothetical protein
MKAIADNICTCGQHGIPYVRRRIPAAIRADSPATQTHIVRGLGTADRRLAKARAMPNSRASTQSSSSTASSAI